MSGEAGETPFVPEQTVAPQPSEQDFRNAAETGDRFVDAKRPTPLLGREIARAGDEQEGDMILPKGTVLEMKVREKSGSDGTKEERILGLVDLGTDLRVGINRYGMDGGGAGTVVFTPSSDQEGNLRRQLAEVHAQSYPLRYKDLMGDNLSADETAELDRLQAQYDEIRQQLTPASENSVKQFIKSRAGLLEQKGISPDNVVGVELKAETHPYGVETPPRLNRELHEPPPVSEIEEYKNKALLEKALDEMDRAKQGLESAAAFTIEDAVNGLRFNEFGKEEHLTPAQVQDVYEAFAKASATRLSPEARQAIIDELKKVPDGLVPFDPNPELIPPRNIVKQGG